MAWQHTIYAYPILFATAISLVLAGYAGLYSRRHGRTTTLWVFAAMNVAIAVWTGFAALKLLSRDPTIQFHAYRLLYLGSASVGPLLLLFALAYTDRTRWLKPPAVAAVFVVPVAFWILLFTNPYGVVIADTRIVEAHGLLILRTTAGPAHIALSFTYALTMAALTLAVVLHEAARRGRSYAPQATLVAIAVVTPPAVSALTSANVAPFTVDNVNFVPASAAVSTVALGIATFRYRLLDLQPIAYRTAIEGSPDGVIVADPGKRVVHANRTVGSLLGREPTTGESVLDVVPGVDPERTGETTVEVQSLDGDAEFLDVRSQRLARHGEDVGWVFVLRDVTERHRRERELEAFTAVVSHDLREPARTTGSYLDELDGRIGEALEPADRELLAAARENAERMQAMISDLLAYSRIGPRPAEFGPVDVERLVAGTVDLLRFEIEDRGATVVVEELPTVRGVDHLLERLFQNLLANALKHADVPAPEIRVSASRRGDSWRLSVRDDGVGIEPDERDRVFDPFARGRRTGAGTGMGLSICQKIVEEHGGTIGVDSTPGEGTEVWLTLPAVREGTTTDDAGERTITDDPESPTRAGTTTDDAEPSARAGTATDDAEPSARAGTVTYRDVEDRTEEAGSRASESRTEGSEPRSS